MNSKNYFCVYSYRMSNLNKAKSDEEFRKMLSYISDRNRLRNVERELNSFIVESFKRLEELILTYITTTNEIHEFVELVGKDFRRVRHLIHKTDVQCNEIAQQFRWMLKFIHTKLVGGKGVKMSLLNNYENRLLDFKLSLILWKHKIHAKNKKSLNLLRKIQSFINALLEVLILNRKWCGCDFSQFF